ncbi:MAG: sulfur oxidation c-type cytochrome SoxA [Thermus sp.]
MRVLLWGMLLLLAWGLSQEVDPREEAKRQKELLLQTAGVLPSELIVEQGKELFYAKRGPKNASLEGCDFGLGPGVLKGASVRLPRYFMDTNKVEDLDSRIRTCMIQLQGFKPEEIKRSEVVAIAFYVAAQSDGMPVQVRLLYPSEKAFYELGERLFYARSGARDIGCATCHVTYLGKRAGVLPYADVINVAGKGAAMTHWPAYRYSNDQAWTMEDRIRACYGNLGHPAPEFYSPAVIALQLFMAYHANGAKAELPGFLR